jgi:Cu-processing system permease protein
MTLARIVGYQLRDVLRGRTVPALALGMGALVVLMTRLGGEGPRILLSLLNISLLLVPLAGVLFGTLYVYHAWEFIELLLTQPLGRRRLFLGLYIGLVLPLGGAVLMGLGLPFAPAISRGTVPGTLLAVYLGSCLLLTAVFVAIGFLIALCQDNRLRGLGAALVAWLLFTVVYDGGVLLAVFAFRAYPIDKPLLALMLLNPVDLARVSVLLQTDAAALMGYTGAAFSRALGAARGPLLAGGAFALWICVPLALAMRRFSRRDF